MIQIPYSELSEKALLGIVDEFITRDSTVTDFTLTEKRHRVLKLLADGMAIITFDPDTESTQIFTKDELKKVQLENDT